MTFQIEHTAWNKGSHLSADHRKKIGLALTGRPKSEEHRAKLIGNKGRSGQNLSVEHRALISKANTKHEEMQRECCFCGSIVVRPPNDSASQFHARKYCSRECKARLQSVRQKGKPFISPMPHETNPSWSGGSINYLKKQARIRDDNTCQSCKLKDLEIMEVDHVIPRSVCPEKYLSLDNLITLCPNDHRRKTNLDRKTYLGRGSKKCGLVS